MKKSLWSSKRSNPVSSDINLNAGCTLVNMRVDEVHWLCIGQDKCGWMQMPVCHSHLLERVLLGYYSALFYFCLTAQGSLPGKSLHWTGYGKKYSYFLFDKCHCALRPDLKLELCHAKHQAMWNKYPFWLLASLSTSEEESLPDSHAPAAQGESPQVGSGLQHKPCSRTCVCDPILQLCLFSIQHLWLPRPSSKKEK